MQAEIDGRAGAAGSRDLPVGDDALLSQNGWQFVGDGEVGGVSLAGEQPAIVQHHRRGANGGEPASGGVVLEDNFPHAWIGAKMRHAGAPGQEKQIEELALHG